MKRVIPVVLSLLTLATVSAGTAAAAPAAGSGGWTCDGQVCLRVVPAAAAKPMNASGCNGSVCINVVGGPSGYSTSGQGYSFYGHIQVYGPNLQHSGGDASNPVASGSGWGSGQTCAVGWAKTTAGYAQVGKPCETVS